MKINNKFLVQQRQPLISDWISCAPPLDVAGTNEPTSEQKSNPYERLSLIEKLDRNEEKVCFWLFLNFFNRIK